MASSAKSRVVHAPSGGAGQGTGTSYVVYKAGYRGISAEPFTTTHASASSPHPRRSATTSQEYKHVGETGGTVPPRPRRKAEVPIPGIPTRPSRPTIERGGGGQSFARYSAASVADYVQGVMNGPQKALGRRRTFQGHRPPVQVPPPLTAGARMVLHCQAPVTCGGEQTEQLRTTSTDQGGRSRPDRYGVKPAQPPLRAPTAR